MSPTTVLALALVLATSAALWASVNALYGLLMGDPVPGTRTRRRALRRIGTMVGLWQITVAIAIVTLGPASTGWPSAIGVGGMGCLFLTGSWLARKTGLPPWWAPE